MRPFSVFHKIDPAFFDNDEATLAAFPDGFERIARVDAEALDHVFELTNHIDTAWPENEGVFMYVHRPVRSTSVGDVVTSDDGRWSCEGIGWRKF